MASRTPQAALRPCTAITFAPQLLVRHLLNPDLQGAQGKEVEQWQSAADHNVIANSLMFSHTLASLRAEHPLGENSGRR